MFLSNWTPVTLQSTHPISNNSMGQTNLKKAKPFRKRENIDKQREKINKLFTKQLVRTWKMLPSVLTARTSAVFSLGPDSQDFVQHFSSTDLGPSTCSP